MPDSLVAVRFATDADLLRYEPRLDDVWPRTDAGGNPKWDWDTFHAIGMEYLERDIRLRRATQAGDVFDIGRVGLRSREHLRPAAAMWALHVAFDRALTQMTGPSDVYMYKAQKYKREAEDIARAELVQIDYDASGNDEIEANEKQRPMPIRFIRG